MYSKDFEKALEFVLAREGGYVNDPDDLGGATNKGITQSTYNSWLKSNGKASKDVKNITDAEVKEIYYKNYWLAAGCNKMTSKFAVVCFDTAVNMRVGRVNEFLKAAKWIDLNEFHLARIRKYNEFAKNQTQRKYLNGWLNRVFALIDFVEKL